MRVGSIRRAPDEPALDATDLNWLIDQWLESVEVDVQALTVDGYRTAVRRWQRWWQKHGPRYEWKLTRAVLKRFEYNLRGEGGEDAILNERSGQPLAWNTRNDSLRRLSEALLWAQSNHYFTDAVAYHEWVPDAQGGAPRRSAATLDQIGLLLEATKLAAWPARSAAAVALTYGVGLRRIECVRLKIEELQFYADYSGMLIAWGKKTKANPTGVRQAAFDAVVGALLVTYLDEIQETKGPFFRQEVNRCLPLGEKGVYRDVKNAVATAGLVGVLIACHDGRRNYTTHVQAMQPNDPLHADRVRRNLGHAHYSQTSAYNLMSVADIVGLLRSPLQQLVDARSQPKAEQDIASTI